MNPIVRVQLSLMMFIQSFIWGAWYVTAPNYLGTIGFKATDFGWTYSVGPIAAMISPFIVGVIADRFFAAQRVLGVLNLLGAAIMFGAISLMKSETPSPSLINLVFFGYMLAFFPTLSLINTLAMKHVGNPQKDFPGIRVLGTIGWIAAGFTLTWVGWEKSIQMFYLSAATAAVMGLYSFTLPDTPPIKVGKVSYRQVLGIDAFVLLKNRSFLVFIICSTLIAMPIALYYQIASRVVEMIELPIGQTMAFGQISEIVFLLVMPLFFARLGVKWMLAVGMLAWAARYALFAIGATNEIHWMIFAGILLHGISYDFFIVTGQIYTDQLAPAHMRAQAQGMFFLFTLGLGMAIGAQVGGQLEAHHTPQASIDLAAEVQAKGRDIRGLEAQMAIATEAERLDLQRRLTSLEGEKGALRKAELEAKDWTAIFGKPALFAGLVLLFFVALFDDDRIKAKAGLKGPIAH